MKFWKSAADIDALFDNPTSKQLFEKFKTSKPIVEIMIIEEKIMNKYKNWNKRTATSPSGNILAIINALFWPFKNNNKTERVGLEEKWEAIIQVHFMTLRISAINSHVYAC